VRGDRVGRHHAEARAGHAQHAGGAQLRVAGRDREELRVLAGQVQIVRPGTQARVQQRLLGDLERPGRVEHHRSVGQHALDRGRLVQVGRAHGQAQFGGEGGKPVRGPAGQHRPQPSMDGCPRRQLTDVPTGSVDDDVLHAPEYRARRRTGSNR